MAYKQLRQPVKRFDQLSEWNHYISIGFSVDTPFRGDDWQLFLHVLLLESGGVNARGYCRMALRSVLVLEKRREELLVTCQFLRWFLRGIVIMVP
ncbi:hypothetical protein [Eleftheria terrae]|uniref:hypothetical protein n=1 Tax=Eleftheria terrae TaxID=1597781 RepID=UPI00263A63EC|nr:hypothetical protein [Eleftheria terrae]WKB50621.1 hypothetical protein N7L95_12275 [Eleftheria terrae]